MKAKNRTIVLDGRSPSGGIPFNLLDGLPLARGDLQSRAVSCHNNDEARAGPTCYGKDPPGSRIRRPVIVVDCRGPSAIFLAESTLSAQRTCHPDVDLSTEGSDRRGSCQIPRPNELGLGMTMQRGWSPPARNGPVCNSPPKDLKSRPERRRVLTSEGYDSYGLYQILRPDKSGLRMTVQQWWSPPEDRPSHRERSPDKVGASVAICQTRFAFGSDCPAFRDPAQRNFFPAETGLAMTVCEGWRPPGRNGLPGVQEGDTCMRVTHRAGPMTRHKRAGEAIQVTLRSRWWCKEEGECDVGFHGSGPPKTRERHPERCRFLTSEGSDQRAVSEILRPKKPGLRMTHSLGWMVAANNSYSADEKQISVLELCEEEKFSRSEDFGTPSFSLIANQTDDLFTIDTFS